jgi:tetratricopeptide (TPR) repeat protein
MDFKSAATFMKKGGKILRKLEDPYFRMIFLNNQAILASTSTIREYDKAKGLAMESYSLAREMGLQSYIAYALSTLGYLEIETKDYGKAIPFYQDSLQQYKVANVKHEMDNALCGLGKAYFFLGEDELAYEYFIESIEIAIEFDIKAKLLLPIVGMARILNREGKKDKALRYVTVVLKHPGVRSRAKVEAIALLTELTGQDDWQEFVVSQAESQPKELDQIVEEVLAAFKPGKLYTAPKATE